MSVLEMTNLPFRILISSAQHTLTGNPRSTSFSCSLFILYLNVFQSTDSLCSYADADDHTLYSAVYVPSPLAPYPILPSLPLELRAIPISPQVIALPAFLFLFGAVELPFLSASCFFYLYRRFSVPCNRVERKVRFLKC